jgi:hypothetical protein
VLSYIVKQTRSVHAPPSCTKRQLVAGLSKAQERCSIIDNDRIILRLLLHQSILQKANSFSMDNQTRLASRITLPHFSKAYILPFKISSYFSIFFFGGEGRWKRA